MKNHCGWAERRVLYICRRKEIYTWFSGGNLKEVNSWRDFVPIWEYAFKMDLRIRLKWLWVVFMRVRIMAICGLLWTAKLNVGFHKTGKFFFCQERHCCIEHKHWQTFLSATNAPFSKYLLEWSTVMADTLLLWVLTILEVMKQNAYSSQPVDLFCHVQHSSLHIYALTCRFHAR